MNTTTAIKPGATVYHLEVKSSETANNFAEQRRIGINKMNKGAIINLAEVRAKKQVRFDETNFADYVNITNANYSMEELHRVQQEREAEFDELIEKRLEELRVSMETLRTYYKDLGWF